MDPTLGIRHHFLQGAVIHIFYQYPFALIGVPSKLYFAQQFVSHYLAVWNHTQHFYEVPYLNRILNTPSQHRVHHGKNKIYLDKNFGGIKKKKIKYHEIFNCVQDIFSFWDILFGTFQEELKEEKPVYGLVHSVKTFNPITLSFIPLVEFTKKLFTTPKFKNKLKVIFYGPGWDYQQKTDSRFGDFESLTVDLDYIFQPKLILNEFIYVILNFFFLYFIQEKILLIVENNSTFILFYSLFAIFTITSISIFFDGKLKLVGNTLEISRQVCMIALIIITTKFSFSDYILNIFISIFILMIFWNIAIIINRTSRSREKYEPLSLDLVSIEKDIMN
ncbi:hypothetical protein HDU92_006758 [Lobulomyces angularis]|nr:hypothetical protein HDU92_006758 [Lobulomyces angularis]